MRVLGAVWVLAVVTTACDGGPRDDAGDVILLRHDMAPTPTAEAGPPDADASDGPLPDVPATDAALPDGPLPDIDPPDVAPPGPCAVPDGVITAETPLDDRARRVQVDGPGADRLAPACGGDPEALTAGRELKVRVIPDRDGPHLVAAFGRFSAIYRTTACSDDEAPDVIGCQIAEAPWEEPQSQGAWLDAFAGEPFDIVADAPAGLDAGPLRVFVYPPVAEGGSCAFLDLGEIRPACAGDTVCLDDTCVYAGPPRVDDIEAWSDGQTLRVAVEYSGRGVVPALWVRTDGVQFTQVRPTLTAQAIGGGRLGGYIESATLARSGRVEVELVDGDARIGRAESAVQALETLRAGAACDPFGLRDVCGEGDGCIEGRCRRTSVDAWTTDAGLNLDVQGARIPVAAEDVNVVIRAIDAEPGSRWSPLPERAAEIGRRWTAVGLPWPEGGLELRLQSLDRPPGLPTPVRPQPQPVSGVDERCDLEGIADRCDGRLACLDAGGVGRCVAVDPPEIRQLQGWAGPDALGLKIIYRDPQGDTDRYTYQVFSPDGELRFETHEPLPLDGAAGVFSDSLPAPWSPAPGDVLVLKLLDASGLVSAPAQARLDDPPDAENGEPCDPLGALDRCADEDAICAALELEQGPRCEAFEEECPPGWRPFPLAVPTRHDDNTSGGPDRTAGVCGGDDSPEAIYEVEARRDARWRVSVLPAGAAVYVRTHCRFPVEGDAEIACEYETFELEVVEGETYYVFVDGPGDGGRFALIIEEMQGPIGPPGPDPVD